MTLEEVKAAVEEIQRAAGDDERAHSQEDALYTSVLKAIAAGAPHAAELAREALKASEIKFSRWCA